MVQYSQLTEAIRASDPEVAALIRAESGRLRTTLSLIPSENFMFPEAALALATPLSTKYSEGYPHVWKDGICIEKDARYYQGQENANRLERLAIERALQLFTPDPGQYHANVQPLSGAPANLEVLSAFLKPGETFMGLALDYGGHLTHGHKVNVTSQYYRAVQYGLNEQNELDYGRIAALAREHRPKLIFCGATAYALTIDFEAFGRIAREVGAILVADISHICGLCVAGVHPHPFPHADVITTTTHKILRGPRAGLIICKKEYGAAIDRAVFPGMQGGPHLNTIAALAITFCEARTEAYRDYARQVAANGRALAESLQQSGFCLVGGKTENHLILIDLAGGNHGLGPGMGDLVAARLEEAGIVINKNAVPGDLKPWKPSGIRLGTPAVTSLGMKEAEMAAIASLIDRAVRNRDDHEELLRIKGGVKALMDRFAAQLPEW
jgi:glycine hydroxymethyltransferase